jgi:orotate phosphoribosyltransferase
MNVRRDELRRQALDDLRRFEVVMQGHFDFGNGFHGRLYLNPHRLFCLPSTIWRVAQDLIDIAPPGLVADAEVIAGPVTGGALLAHTMAGLLEGRRAMTHAPYYFAPFVHADGQLTVSPSYAAILNGRRVIVADDVRNTGQTFRRCADLVRTAGGTLLATVTIIDRAEVTETLGVPNIALVEYQAPPNYPAASCPLCAVGTPVLRF